MMPSENLTIMFFPEFAIILRIGFFLLVSKLSLIVTFTLVAHIFYFSKSYRIFKT